MEYLEAISTSISQPLSTISLDLTKDDFINTLHYYGFQTLIETSTSKALHLKHTQAFLTQDHWLVLCTQHKNDIHYHFFSPIHYYQLLKTNQ